MTNKEIIQISKSKPNKISILCTFKQTGTVFSANLFVSYNVQYVTLIKQTHFSGGDFFMLKPLIFQSRTSSVNTKHSIKSLRFFFSRKPAKGDVVNCLVCISLEKQWWRSFLTFYLISLFGVLKIWIYLSRHSLLEGPNVSYLSKIYPNRRKNISLIFLSLDSLYSMEK